MKGFLAKGKSKYRIRQWKMRISKAVSMAAFVALLLGMCQAPALAAPLHAEKGVTERAERRQREAANASEGGKDSVTVDIYHRHSGNETEGGGCFQEVLYHEHIGNETEGGSCYETPVYHSHEGSETEGGGCFNSVVYHSHEGNETEGGNCYAEVYHSHTSNCEASKKCTLTYTVTTYAYETYYDTCYHHGESVYCKTKVKATHGTCGSGSSTQTVTHCHTCGAPSSGSHTYTAITCGNSTSTIIGYELSCGKTETTPEYYETDCGKDEATIDAYALSCEKTDLFIDGYERNCGFSEEIPVARLLITNETSGTGTKVVLRASLEDLTEGRIDFSGGSFHWYDENENLISGQETAEVTSNGNYLVEFVPGENSNNLTEIKGDISVGNVYIPTPAPTAEKTEQEKEDGEDEMETQEDEGPMTSPTPSATPTQSPTLRPTMQPKEDSAEEEASEDTDEMQAKESASPEPMESSTPKPTPTKTPEMSMVQITPGEEEVENHVLGEERKTPFGKWLGKVTGWFSQPGVAVITITAGTLLLIGGLYFLWFVLRRSVVVFNDDGTGQMLRLGRCMVLNEGEDFSVTISEAMEEKSCTARYCIKPGLFRLGRRKEQVLFVCKGQKRISVYLSKEMIVFI